MSYKSNIKNTFITKVFSLGISFTISVILARALGATDRGYLQYLLLITSLLSQFGHLSIIDTTTFFQKKSEYTENSVYSSNLLVLIFIWLVETLIILIFKNNNIILFEYSYLLIMIGLISVLLTFIVSLITALETGNNRIIHINNTNLIGMYSKFGIVVLLYLIDRLTIYSYLIVTLIHVLVESIIFLKKYNKPVKPKINIGLIIKEVKFGFFVYLASLFIFLNYRADQFMIKELLSITDLGVYVVAVNIAELIFTVPNSVISSYRGEMYRLTNEEEHKKLRKKDITLSTIKYTYLFSIVITVIVFFASYLIPFIYGNEYQGAVAAIQLLLPGIVFGTIGKVSANYFIIEGKPKVHMYVSLLVLVINIVLNYFLIIDYAIYGAAIGSTIAYLFYGITYLIMLKLTAGINPIEVLYISKKDIVKITGFLKVSSKFKK